MPPDRSSFSALNLPPSFSLPICMDYFTLSAGPNTNLWRKPPNGDTSTAPMVFTSLRRPFVVAEVTISADWEMEWDQGGLVIFAGSAPGQSSVVEPLPFSAAGGGHHHHRGMRNSAFSRSCKWVKAGMEFSSGTVNASSVSATSDGADWCLSPLAMPNIPTNITSLRIKLERVGHSLWIWYQIPSLSPYAVTPGAVGSTWKKLREVTWFFYGVEDKCVHVGVYASRPTSIQRGGTVWEAMNGVRNDESVGDDGGGGSGGNKLVVEFEDLEIF
jgi:regulation of enolase protein 1 (concanavalin A-like superfamily)